MWAAIQTSGTRHKEQWKNILFYFCDPQSRSYFYNCNIHPCFYLFMFWCFSTSMFFFCEATDNEVFLIHSTIVGHLVTYESWGAHLLLVVTTSMLSSECLCDVVYSQTWTGVHLNPGLPAGDGCQTDASWKPSWFLRGTKCQRRRYLDWKWLSQLNSVIAISQAEE